MLWRNPTIASWNIYYKKGLYKPEEIVYNESVQLVRA